MSKIEIGVLIVIILLSTYLLLLLLNKVFNQKKNQKVEKKQDNEKADTIKNTEPADELTKKDKNIDKTNDKSKKKSKSKKVDKAKKKQKECKKSKKNVIIAESVKDESANDTDLDVMKKTDEAITSLKKENSTKNNDSKGEISVAFEDEIKEFKNYLNKRINKSSSGGITKPKPDVSNDIDDIDYDKLLSELNMEDEEFSYKPEKPSQNANKKTSFDDIPIDVKMLMLSDIFKPKF